MSDPINQEDKDIQQLHKDASVDLLNKSGEHAQNLLESPVKLEHQNDKQDAHAEQLLQSQIIAEVPENTTENYAMAESIIVKGESVTVHNTEPDNNTDRDEQIQQSTLIQQRAKINMQNTMIVVQESDEKPLEENLNLMPENFYYAEDHQDREKVDYPISQQTLMFYDTFGNDSLKRYNLWLVDDETVTFAAGISYNFMNFETGKSQIFFSKDGGGIGSVAVHPNRKFYAVAEKGNLPNVYIYSYPDHKLYRILRKGTEKSYSSCTFSHDGEKVATVGSSPDFQICIWDWKQENILLKSKAFAQEVYRVQFSSYNPNILSTSGMGHIKFWKVAETFTGLKLKGEIAKFGQVELSDVYAFFQFPDGKVLSGTEYGALILWEGNVIKCVVRQSEEKPCHDGQIEIVFLDGEYIVSAGSDGYIKLWKFSDIDQAEGDDFLNYFMSPAKEVLLELQDGDHAHILSIQRAEIYWIIGDAHGRIWKIELPDFEKREIIFNTNSGKMHDMAICPVMNSALTVGQDGCVRLWNYINNKLHYMRKFACEATCCEWIPFNKKNQGRVVVVGYSNGIVRLLLLRPEGFFLLKALKVHSQPITFLKVSGDGSLLAVLSQAGNLFLLQITTQDLQQIEPFCLYETQVHINDITFDRRGEKLLMGSKEGNIYEIKIPKFADIDNSQTYLIPFEPKVWGMKMMESQKPKKEEMDLEFLLRRNKDEKIPEVEWDPAPILNVAYYDNDCTRVIATVDGKFLGLLYIIDWNKDRPVDALYGPKIPSQYLSFQDNNELLVMGFKNGSFQLRHRSDFRQFTGKESHDVDYGHVKKVLLNYDKTAVLSVGNDGTLFVYKIDYQGFIQAARGMYIESYSYPELGNGINSGTFSDDIHLESEIEEDIINDKIYSIQEAKLLVEEDNKKNEADKMKLNVKGKIKKLRTFFTEIFQKNQQADEFSKLTSDELCVDPEYIEMLHSRAGDDLEETRKELEWEQSYNKLMTDKLKSYVKDELEVDKFAVNAILKPKTYVQTFKVKKLSHYVLTQLEEIYRLIEEEKRNQAQREQEQQIIKSQAMEQTTAIKLTVQQSQMPGQTQSLPNATIQQDFQKSQEQQQQHDGEAKKSSAKAERERQKQEEEKIRRETEELEKTKPTKESFEPEYQRDVQEANDTLGDYKLKSSKDYIVPEQHRMNVSKKRKHMFLLEEFLYNTKIKFNNQLITLKSKKLHLIDKIKIYNEKISKINTQLGRQETLFTPEIDKESEDPDSYMKITDEQIDEFAKQKLKDANKKTQGFQGMGGGGVVPPPTTEPVQVDKKPTAQVLPAKQVDQKEQVLKLRKGIRVQTSELEEEIKVIQEMILQAEKKRMMEEIDEEIKQFDKDVVKCQNEKQVLESDMKIAKMKLVTFYQELIILEDMEEYDNKLIKELLDFKKEKMSLDEQSQRIVENLQNLAKKEQQNEKDLNEQMKAFKELVYPDDDHKREKIHQYYLRKYKKDKAKKMKVSNQDDENDDDDDDDVSQEAEEEEDFADDDDDEKPDISPVENDMKIKEIIDKICELEDNQETNRKEKMDSERQKVQIANKNMLIQKDLEKAEDELRAFQRKKLQRVNQLDVSYMLKLSQIQNLLAQGDTFKLPADLNASILFTESEFYRLCKRIRELELEQKKIERQKKQKEKTKKVFEKEIAIKITKIDDLNKKYEEKHILKFGDIIDLKILDALEPTKQVIDMRDVFKHEEKEAVKRVEVAKKSLQSVKKRLLDSKKENTKIINNITKLGKQQMDLSKKLDSTNKQLFKEENEERRSDLEREKQNLKDLVKFLSKEIEDLKTEIGLFKRKGGHIYTMVTSTKKQFN